MARKTLVLDASVGVKWFSSANEAGIPQARSILLEHAKGNISLMVPELFYHEISNALIHKTAITTDRVLESITTLMMLKLDIFPISGERLRSAVQIARDADITEYDAYYAVAAIENHCPLVTANPKHQQRIHDCKVIPITEWKGL